MHVLTMRFVCLYEMRMHVCSEDKVDMYVCMHVCMYVCKNKILFNKVKVCTHAYIHTNTCAYIQH